MKDTAATVETHAPDGFFGELAELAGLAAFRVDAERNLVAWSRGVAELTGYEPEDVLGLPCVVALRCPECMGGCDVFDRGHVRDIPLTLRRKDGSLLRVRKSGATVLDRRGGIGGAVEVLRPAEGGETQVGGMEQLLVALGREWLMADERLTITDLADSLAARIGRTAASLRGGDLVSLFGVELFGEDSPFRNAVAGSERREDWRATLQTATGPETVSVSAGRFEAGAGGRIFALIHPEIGAAIDDDDAPAEIRSAASVAKTAASLSGPNSGPAGEDLMPDEAAEADAIAEALEASRYRRKEAAERLGMSRTTLWRKMKQYRLG